MINKLLKQKGLTIIELSIICIIVSLLIMVVIYGNNLIKTAKVNALINEINNFRTSTASFVEKYNEIPGDSRKVAIERIGNLTPADGGNNDGIIGDKNVATPYFEQESYEFFKQLSETGLIDFDSKAPNGGDLTSLSEITIDETYPGTKLGNDYFFYIDTSTVYDVFKSQNKIALFNLKNHTTGISGDLMKIFIKKFNGIANLKI